MVLSKFAKIIYMYIFTVGACVKRVNNFRLVYFRVNIRADKDNKSNVKR